MSYEHRQGYPPHPFPFLSVSPKVIVKGAGYVDFLLLKEKEGEDPILQVAGCLSGEPLSAAAIERELYGRASS